MRKILIVLMLCICAQGVYGQETYNSSGKKGEAKRKELKPKGFDASRLVLGGGAILNFGTGYANVGLSPMVGYKFGERFAAGVGISYQYYRNKFEQVGIVDQNNNLIGIVQYDRKTSLYSANVWARYIVWRNLFVHVQPEMMNVGVPTLVQDPVGNLDVGETREYVPAVLVGLGLRQPITGTLSLYLTALYDVIQNPSSPYYKNLDFRFGFNIGF